ncbi:MAG: FtsX-like permease family protein [Ilumatobacteraceae bacterium]
MLSGAATTIARGELRRRPLSYAALAMIIAIGGGASLGAAITAHRTDRAYPDYTHRAHVATLVVNPSLASVAMDKAIRRFRGVRAVHTSALMLASLGATKPAPLSELEQSSVDAYLQVIGSPDGRFVEVDRPQVSSGRPPTGDREIFISDDERPVLEAEVGHKLALGDSVDVAFWWSFIEDPSQDPSKVISPIGVESLSISGFGQLPDEVLPDELYPRQHVVVSADVARKYNCLADYRPDMTDEEALATAMPQSCSTSYWYYSLSLDDSPGVVDSIRTQFATAADALKSDLPPLVTSLGGGYFYISQDRADVDTAVSRAIRPTVTALLTFALVALLTMLTIFAIVLARVVRRTEADSRTLASLGASVSQRARGVLGPILISLAIGLAGALGTAALVSPVGPVGSVRSLVGSPGMSLPGRLTCSALGAFAVALLAIAVAMSFVGVRRASRSTAGSRPTRRWFAALSRSDRPSLTNGVAAALDVRRSGTGAAIGGCVVAVACGVGALVFAYNLTSLIGHPKEYGWPWDVGVITGAGYGDAKPDAVAATLDHDPEVERYALYAFDSSSKFGDRSVPVVYGFSSTINPDLTIVDGRAPRKAGEAVLGEETARQLALGVGDHVTVQSNYLSGNNDVEVVGTAVLPAVSAFIADRTGLGNGAFVLTDQQATADAATFVAIHLRPGVDPSVFTSRLGPTFRQWDATGAPPFIYSAPVRSPEIVNVSELRSVPLVLGGVLGAALLAGLTTSILISVRDRRRELAILRALGYNDRDLRATIRWQAGAMMATGVVIGIPLGVIAGHLAWRAFANQLGVVPRADSPLALLGITAVLAIALALVASIAPSRSATRMSPVEALRRN